MAITASILAAILAIIFIVIYFFKKFDSEDDFTEEPAKSVPKNIRLTVIICSACAILACIMPTKKTIIIGVGADKAITMLSEVADTPIAKKTVRLLEAKLDAELKEIEEELSPEVKKQVKEDETVDKVLKALEKRAGKEVIKAIEEQPIE